MSGFSVVSANVQNISVYLFELLLFLLQCLSSILHTELDLPLLYWGTLCPLDKYDSFTADYFLSISNALALCLFLLSVLSLVSCSLRIILFSMSHINLNSFLGLHVTPQLCYCSAFSAWIAGLIQTLLYGDFFYYYFQR